MLTARHGQIFEKRALVGFFIVDGTVTAAVGVDRGGDPELDADSEMMAADMRVAQRASQTAAELADEAVDLWSLVD